MATPRPWLTAAWWRSSTVWKRARANTTRCLIGCSVGDFSALFAMQHFEVPLSTGSMMAIAMGCGLATSFGLETAVLRVVEGMPAQKAAVTALNMSAVSMLVMESAENLTDLYLTGGVFAPHEPAWWVALGVSVGAGFAAPLPYNYYRLKRFGKSCH